MSVTSPPIFRWDTLREVGPLTLNYRPRVSGRLMEVELFDSPGTWIRVWQAGSTNDDILVWRDKGLVGTPHSAILLSPIVDSNLKVAQLHYSSGLRTKNGMLAETNATLEDLVNVYGEMYNIYRRRK